MLRFTAHSAYLQLELPSSGWLPGELKRNEPAPVEEKHIAWQYDATQRMNATNVPFARLFRPTAEDEKMTGEDEKTSEVRRGRTRGHDAIRP